MYLIVNAMAYCHVYEKKFTKREKNVSRPRRTPTSLRVAACLGLESPRCAECVSTLPTLPTPAAAAAAAAATATTATTIADSTAASVLQVFSRHGLSPPVGATSAAELVEALMQVPRRALTIEVVSDVV